MISVLIPVYNYNIVDLVGQIHKQLELCNRPFEIICFDDRSESNNTIVNKGISDLDHTKYVVSKINLGRTQARQELAKAASYDWLLFLDADVLPKKNTYIEDYLELTNKDLDAVYGGFAYYDTVPSSEFSLRWTYGKTHEQISANQRNQRPYKVIISANFMIRKSLFLELNANIEQKGYGYDNYFGGLLKEKGAKVFHIDNEVYHLGIETNSSYLRKKEQAAETLLHLYRTKELQNHQNDLLRLFSRSKRIGLNYLFSLLYKAFKSGLQKNLLSANPSMIMFQLYRICYLCHKDLTTT
ncbi:MAG: glycosyltransferase family 2 protein [Psychroserpens sp.]|nr:glycosyltransferase family 2 protein [Psychroserpens sp.]